MNYTGGELAVTLVPATGLQLTGNLGYVDPRYTKYPFTFASPTIKGTGLGLAICRQIVRHYGGHIWAASQLGAGSAFYVRLPGAGACLGQAVPA